MTTYSRILAWRIPWTEEPGRLLCMGSQRVRHDWVTEKTTPTLHLVSNRDHVFLPFSESNLFFCPSVSTSAFVSSGRALPVSFNPQVLLALQNPARNHLSWPWGQDTILSICGHLRILLLSFCVYKNHMWSIFNMEMSRLYSHWFWLNRSGMGLHLLH